MRGDDEMEILDEAEKELKRLFYRGKIEILEGYLANARQAIEDMEIGIHKYRNAHATYVTPWSGETRTAYDQVAGELSSLEKSIVQLGEELVDAIKREIRRLEGKVDEYR
jgi:VIT1/CCC1 family predicted Fe2+/Mn2+ transporter